jgi:hypothetical protein
MAKVKVPWDLLMKGRRRYGGFIHTSTSLHYYAFRKPKEIFKDAPKGTRMTFSAALDSGKACWAIDEETYMLCRRRGVQFIGVWVETIKTVFMTAIDNFADPHKYHRRNYSAKGGADQRYLPVHFFEKRCLPVF